VALKNPLLEDVQELQMLLNQETQRGRERPERERKENNKAA